MIPRYEMNECEGRAAPSIVRPHPGELLQRLKPPSGQGFRGTTEVVP